MSAWRMLALFGGWVALSAIITPLFCWWLRAQGISDSDRTPAPGASNDAG